MTIDYFVDNLSMNDFQYIRLYRENMYGPFSFRRFLNFIKQNPKQVAVLRKTTSKRALAYIILYLRDKEDSWIYQLGYDINLTSENLKSLLDYAEDFIQGQLNCNRIRILVRDTQTALTNVLEDSHQWQNIDSILIYEKYDFTNIPDFITPNMIKIREASTNDIEGVQNVDFSAFRVGYRVPKNSFLNHLSNAGSFVAIDTKTNQIVGYNYNDLTSNKSAHFIRLATLDGFKRKGVGSALLHNALIWFKAFGIKYCYLRSIPNSAGSKVYEKFGFNQSGYERTYEFTK